MVTITILIPCFNEQETIIDTIHELNTLNYSHYEIVVINDGSKDRSLNDLYVLVEMCEKVRVINLKKNLGKANALKCGLMASLGDIIVTLDSDVLRMPDHISCHNGP